MSLEITLTGLTEVQRVLDLLTAKSLVRVGKGAETAAMGILVKGIKNTFLFKDRTGLLRKSQGQKPWRKKNFQVAIVGARVRFKGTYKGKPVVPWRYEHLVHDGHDVYPNRKYGGKRWGNKPIGRVEPRRFHEKAWEESKDSIASTFINEFRTRWDRAVNEAVQEAGAKK